MNIRRKMAVGVAVVAALGAVPRPATAAADPLTRAELARSGGFDGDGAGPYVESPNIKVDVTYYRSSNRTTLQFNLDQNGSQPRFTYLVPEPAGHACQHSYFYVTGPGRWYANGTTITTGTANLWCYEPGKATGGHHVVWNGCVTIVPDPQAKTVTATVGDGCVASMAPMNNHAEPTGPAVPTNVPFQLRAS
jgi:hypothetical protein